MRVAQAEKMETIRLVEGSVLPVKQTLAELDIPRSTFYGWYRRYLEDGYDGLADQTPQPRRFWNRIPEHEKQRVVKIALEKPELTPRELACHIIDTQGYFLSESSVYRILKAYDLLASPNYIVLSARDRFPHPTQRIHELWQTDFTYLKVIGWGWYYLSTVMDDYSRYILAWKLCSTMHATDVKDTLDLAIAQTGVTQVQVRHRPRLLSDNGPCYLAGELREYLDRQGIEHTRGAPFHPMTQGKIERYHRTMKNVLLLQNYYLPGELEREIERFVEYYNHQRVHESLNNVTPADVLFGRAAEILARREETKRVTMQQRRRYNLACTTQAQRQGITP